MFRKITATAAALAMTATLAVAVAPADAARSLPSGDDTTFSGDPTGPHTMSKEDVPQKYISGTDDDHCEEQANAANSWIDAAVEAWYRDDYAAMEKAQNTADAIAGEANAEGCVIYD